MRLVDDKLASDATADDWDTGVEGEEEGAAGEDAILTLDPVHLRQGSRYLPFR